MQTLQLITAQKYFFKDVEHQKSKRTVKSGNRCTHFDTFYVQCENVPLFSEARNLLEPANTAHLLNIWQAIQKGCCVLRVTRVILTTAC